MSKYLVMAVFMQITRKALTSNFIVCTFCLIKINIIVCTFCPIKIIIKVYIWLLWLNVSK